ncbi:MAG: WecB/TagA/CpsF family glycosyltransferase [Bacteroidales bacterium]|nr:WecB/TagA/CpsF family glycosyltransferase [Bacteroidales bacterium]
MRVPFYNIFIDVESESSVLEFCEYILKRDTSKSVGFLNAHCFNLTQKNLLYRESLSKFDLILNDGVGISIAGKIRGVKFKENLNGTDLIPKIIEKGYKLNKIFYLLGTKNHALDKAIENLNKKHPGIKIAGKHHGFINQTDNIKIINEIVINKVDIVVVGMGVPHQELWIQSNKDLLPNVQLFVAGGAIIDFISGIVKRAPRIFRILRLEWLFRLIIEPKRMWRRYLIGNLLFFYNILKNR